MSGTSSTIQQFSLMLRQQTVFFTPLLEHIRQHRMLANFGMELARHVAVGIG